MTVQVEDDSGVPVPRVRVRVFDESETELLATAFTDSAGATTIIVPTSVDVEDPGIVSSTFSVDAVYPNPVSADMNRVVTIAYSAPVSYSDVPRLEIFDLLGRKVSSSDILSAGVYVYRVDFGTNQLSKTRTFVVADGGPVEVRLARGDRSRSNRTQPSPAKTANSLASLVLRTDKPGYQPAGQAIETAGQDLEVTLEMASAAHPQAVFVVSGTLEEGGLVSFDATSSVDAAGGGLTYSWAFGDGKRGARPRSSHTYLRTGSYEITLVVSGTHGAVDTTRKAIEIAPGPQPSSLTGVVSGVVFDQLQNPLRDVMVSVVGDTATELTGPGGHVQLQDVPVGVPVFLTLAKSGYSTQQVSVTLESDTTEAYFRASLLERRTPIRVRSVENGASIAGADGVRLNIPYDGLIDEDGNRVTGEVLVSLTPVDVVEQTAAFPGRFEAVDENGSTGGLQSYGVAEFTISKDGRDVQLAPGRTASIDIPIYTGGAVLGNEIALWSVDEETGQWTQEGTGIVTESEASPTGLALRADVGHFSWWNCDDFFDPDVRNPGVCYKKECDSGVCFDVAVGCWAGGRRKPLQKSSSRLDTEPVFEVRTYISPAGARLLFPPDRETEVFASSLGGLFTATVSVTGVAGNESPLDIFLEPSGIEVDTVQIAYGDTLAATYVAFQNPQVYGFFVGETEVFEVKLISDGFAGSITMEGGGQSIERQLTASGTTTLSGSGLADRTFFVIVDGTSGTPGDYRIALRKTGVFEWIEFDENGEVFVQGTVGPQETRVFTYRAEAGDGIYAEIVDTGPDGLPAEDVTVRLKRWSTNPFSSCCQTTSSIASASERLEETSGAYSVEIEDRRNNGGTFALRMFR
ncbi:MAG: PKD domain-containing protein, partial [Rhodothermales bacterium]|nr:PKD domain-containing protein [Rhodothermales bacterium]